MEAVVDDGLSHNIVVGVVRVRQSGESKVLAADEGGSDGSGSTLIARPFGLAVSAARVCASGRT